MRMVPQEEWPLSDLVELERRTRLLNPFSPENLLAAAFREAEDSARQDLVTLDWQETTDPEAPRGFFRLVAQIPASETIFDQLFNGRSGYRAQFYLSPQEGEAFNRAIVDGLRGAVAIAFTRRPLDVSLQLIEQSLSGPYSKIWVFKDKQAFNKAQADTLNPPRWVQNSAHLGRRLPLPSHLGVDLKGTFINPTSGEKWVREYKRNRCDDLYRRGYS
jgi:hypothetical protein